MKSPNTRIWIPGLQERFIEYENGIKTFMSVGPKGEWQFRYEFDDLEPEVSASRELAKNDDHWKKGVKAGQVHYAHIPPALLFKWHCEGVDIKDTSALFLQVDKPEWRYLKCVDKIHVAKS